jgi:hypothetical protein
MSKVVIQGNASGTGDFTIAAPNSDTNRTLTLPDVSGTLVTGDDIAINGITSDYTSGTALNIDSSGRVTMPYQPAFNAVRTASHVTNAVVIWNSVSTNVGGHYNATSGLFTAPVAGNYFFIANAICGASTAVANSGSLQLRVNGSSIKDSHWNMSDPWENVTTLAVVTLNANDFVDVYVSGNFMVGTGIYSQFNGYLIG